MGNFNWSTRVRRTHEVPSEKWNFLFFCFLLISTASFSLTLAITTVNMQNDYRIALLAVLFHLDINHEKYGFSFSLLLLVSAFIVPFVVYHHKYIKLVIREKFICIVSATVIDDVRSLVFWGDPVPGIFQL